MPEDKNTIELVRKNLKSLWMPTVAIVVLNLLSFGSLYLFPEFSKFHTYQIVVWAVFLLPTVIVVWAGYLLASAVKGGFLAGGIGGGIVSIAGGIITGASNFMALTKMSEGSYPSYMEFQIVLLLSHFVFGLIFGIILGVLGGFIAKEPKKGDLI